MGHKWVTAEQPTGSREASGHRSFCRGVWHVFCEASLRGPQRWQLRQRRLFKRLGSRFRPYERTSEPRARKDRSKWRHGSPDGKRAWARCRTFTLQDAGCSAPRDKISRVTCTSTGNICYSHLDQAGEPSGAIRDPRERPPRRPTCPDGRRTAPTGSRQG